MKIRIDGDRVRVTLVAADSHADRDEHSYACRDAQDYAERWAP